MATQLCTNSPLTVNSHLIYLTSPIKIYQFKPLLRYSNCSNSRNFNLLIPIRCSSAKPTEALRTCKNCKSQFDPSLNNPRSCRYHTAHFGGTQFLLLCFIRSFWFAVSVYLYVVFAFMYKRV